MLRLFRVDLLAPLNKTERKQMVRDKLSRQNVLNEIAFEVIWTTFYYKQISFQIVTIQLE